MISRYIGFLFVFFILMEIAQFVNDHAYPILAALLMGAFTGYAAHTKNRSFLLWMIFGCISFAVSMVVLFSLGAAENSTGGGSGNSGTEAKVQKNYGIDLSKVKDYE